MSMIRILVVVFSLAVSSAAWGENAVYRGPKGARLSLIEDSSVEGDKVVDCYLQTSGEFYTATLKEVDGIRRGTLKFYQQSTDKTQVLGEVTLKVLSDESLSLALVLASVKDHQKLKPDPSGTYQRLDYAGQVKLARELHGRADAKLNEVYGRVMGKFSEEKRIALRKDARDWIEYRDYKAEHPGPLYLRDDEKGDSDIIKKIKHWDALTDLTDERVKMLQLYEKGNPEQLISGVWVDGKGGRMELSLNEVDKKKGINFSIYTIRGPTAHIGEIEGFATFSNPEKRKAVFIDTDTDYFIDGKACRIDLFIDGEKIRIEEKNAQSYHGKRAYFAGTYYRLGPLEVHQ